MHKKFCDCFETCHANMKWHSEVKVHPDTQDRSSRAWENLQVLIKEAANDQREVFDPSKELGSDDWSSIETLPAEISTLKHVKHLRVPGSSLTWIPPEIGDMEALEEFTPYTSYRLHWFPYEITKCRNLKKSTISTRALYGNYKYRLPFPHLSASPVSLYKERARCSVCDSSTEKDDLSQVWLSMNVATDVVPLLAHTCSPECLQQLPDGADGYIKQPHQGGLGLEQPEKQTFGGKTLEIPSR